METKSIQVLLVEDNPGDARLISEMLADAAPLAFELSHVEQLADTLSRLDTETFDLVLLDLTLPDAQGLDTFNRIQTHRTDVPIMVLTGSDDQALATKAVRQGAQDFLVKGKFDSPLLVRAMQYAIERAEIQADLTRARDELEQQVLERTAELEQANKALQIEIAERRRAEQSLWRLNDKLESRVLERTISLTEANAELRRQIEERKQAEDQILRHNRELLSLQAAAAATASSLDLRFVLDTVTWEMASLLEVEGCTISEWNDKANTLLPIANYPAAIWPEQNTPGKTQRLEEYPLKMIVLQERRAQQVTISDPDAGAAESAHMREEGIKTLLMLPMIFQHRVVGLVEMKDSRSERTFTDHEISLTHLLANQAASAIENARLYEQAQQELSKREEAERRIKASLQEKEVLLREIHHRVKNNLQVITSLLYLQSRSITDPEILEMFQDSQNRVRSMALVHEELYKTRDLAQINLSEYIRELAAHLFRSYSLDSNSVTLKVNADETALGVDTAVPCGLIINELLSNSLKHAFPMILDPGGGDGRHQQLTAHGRAGASNGGSGEIYVQLDKDPDGQLLLRIGDNGVGFPEDMDFRNTESLGLQLVNILVNQLQGTIELNSHGGTEFRITLKA